MSGEGRVTSTVQWTGQTLTRGALELLLDKADPDPGTIITVRTEPSYPSPTDPGGGITISMQGKL